MMTGHANTTPTPCADSAAGRTASLPAWPALLLLALGAALYANSLRGVFVLDDVMWIVDNPRLRQPWPHALGLDGVRPLLAASLALNYAWTGLAPWSYHLVNVAAHLLATLALFGVVRRTLLLPRFQARFAGRETPVALAVAALWMAHPLQTAAVDYVVQRGEVFMGLFCLTMLYAVIRAAGAPRPWPWLALAATACAAGMAFKETMIVAPVLVAAYDVLFLTGSARETLRRRWPAYLASALLCAAMLPWFFRLQSAANASAGFAVKDVTAWSYLLTQSGVILHYLGLAFWPHPLAIDYAWPFASSLADVWPAAVAVLLLIAATVWALRRAPAWGYLGLWFFVALAPTSSFVPVADACFDHRMYLPLAALVTAVVLCGALAADAWRAASPAPAARWVPAVALLAAIALLGFATILRNADYADARTLWRGALDVNPRNARALFNCGYGLTRDDMPQALACMARAAELRPNDAAIRNGYGKALAMAGKLDEARAEFDAALLINPRFARALDNLGVLEARAGHLDRAAGLFARAVEIRPEDAEAHSNLGTALLRLGRRDEGLSHLREAVRLRPDNPAFHRNLSRAESPAPDR